ncbi:MAG: alcohol dehydrogenase, partial [Azospirillum sp.]|nr:alcohol dehydrogenase [Azospirillum sp.]
AGIYVLSPAAVAGLDADTPLDMPTLLRDRMAAGHTLRAYRIEDYWIDIGRQTDFARANDDFRRMFGGRADDGAEER